MQFDLAYHVSEQELANHNFGRRKPPQDLCKDVKEALMWQTPESPIGRAGTKKKTMIEKNKILMERSPEKWKTMYRDQFRKFTHSPQKQEG